MLMEHMRKVKDSMEVKCKMVKSLLLSYFPNPSKRISTATSAKRPMKTTLKYSVDRFSTLKAHSTKDRSINRSTINTSWSCASLLSLGLFTKRIDRKLPRMR